MQVCTSLQADNHTRTPPLSFLQAQFFTGRMLFLPPNQQRHSTEGIQSTEGTVVYTMLKIKVMDLTIPD